MRSTKRIIVAASIDVETDKQILTIVKNGIYRNKSHLIEVLITKGLESVGKGGGV